MFAVYLFNSAVVLLAIKNAKIFPFLALASIVIVTRGELWLRILSGFVFNVGHVRRANGVLALMVMLLNGGKVSS